MKKILSLVLAFAFLLPAWTLGATEERIDQDTEDVIDVSIFDEGVTVLSAAELTISAPSAILIEKETGTVLYEKNPDERMAPASVTKVMTMLLIVEELEAGNLALTDMVTTSTKASGMGGSQIFLKEGEQMSVQDLLKSIVVASANDACVAMAEHISGSEEAFVSRMNARAQELGMANTTFMNCNGLPADGHEHLTTARDISTMSRELIKHDMIKEYTTVWMDTVRGGAFGLTNTNKLIYHYEGATGLKTGFTQEAMYCVSATAERNGVEYIAVILHGETSDQRFADAKALLSYAFSNYTMVEPYPDSVLAPIPVELGESDYVQPVLSDTARLLVGKNRVNGLKKVVEIVEGLSAPVEQGQQLGTLTVYDGDQTLATIPIVAGDSVAKLTWWQIFVQFLNLFFTGG